MSDGELTTREDGIGLSKRTLSKELAPIYKEYGSVLAPGLNLDQMSTENIEEGLYAVINHPAFDQVEVKRELDFLPYTKRGLKLLSDATNMISRGTMQMDQDDEDILQEEIPALLELMQQAREGYGGTISEEDKDFAEDTIKQKIEILEPIVKKYLNPQIESPVVDTQSGEPDKLIGGLQQSNGFYIDSSGIYAKGSSSGGTWYVSEFKYTGGFSKGMSVIAAMAKNVDIQRVVISGHENFNKRFMPFEGFKKISSIGKENKKIAALRGFARTALHHPRWYEKNQVKIAFCL